MSEIITLTFNNWNKYQPRADYKKNWWFAFSNDFLTNQNFLSFTNDERLVFIYLLCEASKNNKKGTIEVVVNTHGRVMGVSKTCLLQAIEKLKERGICTESVQNPFATEQNRTEYTHKAEKSAERKKFNFEEIYAAYPKRDGDNGKAKAFAKLKNKVTSEESYQELLMAVNNYARYCSGRGWVGTGFVKQFLTFVNSDWNEWTSQTHSVNINPDTLARIRAIRNEQV